MISKKNIIKSAFSQLANYRFMFALLFFVAALGTVFTTLNPYAIKLVINNIISEQQHVPVWPFLLLGLLWVASELLNRLKALLGLYLYPKLRARAKSKIFEAISRKEYTFFSKRLSGNITERAKTLSSFYVEIVDKIVFSSLALVINLIMVNFFLFKINEKLILSIYLWLIVHTLISFLFYPKAMSSSQCEQQVQSEASGQLTNYINNFILILVLGAWKRAATAMRSKFDKVARTEIQTGWCFEKMRILQAVFATTLMLVVIAQLYSFINQHQITLGDIPMVLMLVNGVITSFYSIYEEFYAFFVLLAKAQDNIAYLQLTLSRKKSLISLPVGHYTLSTKKLCCNYPGQPSIIQDFSTTIQPKEKVAIVGKNGCGKSTLLYSLMGLIESASGSVTLNNINLNQLDSVTINKIFTFIPQHKFLFHDTIMENLKITAPHLTEIEIKERVTELGCSDTINKLENGYDTVVSEHSSNLSGGQRQVIGLLQGLLQVTPIVMIDEPFNMIDAQKTKALFDCIFKACQDSTLIVVTHDMEHARMFDRIIKI